MDKGYYQVLFNLTSRSRFDRLECFYTEGTNEWYVGYIKRLDAGLSVHFGATDYPPPKGLENYELREGISREEAQEVAEEQEWVDISPKRVSKFTKWRSNFGLGFVDPSASQMEEAKSEEEKEPEKPEEEEEEEEEERQVKP